MTDRAIMIDHDGDNTSGCYRIYPANEASEPPIYFQAEHHYGYDESLPSNYASRAEARTAAESRAARLARSIGGVWMSNEN